MNWKFVDDTKQVVFKVEGAYTYSASVTAPEVVDWIRAGNTPDPATPPIVPPLIDYGADADTRDDVVAAVTLLRQFLGVSSPTQAQSVTALKLLIRVVLLLAQRMLG